MTFPSVPIVFTNLPLLQELCLVVASIDPLETKDKSVKSDFQWQLLKTRIVIFTDFNIIAAPVETSLTCIYIIVKNEVLNNNLGTILSRNRLKIEYVGKPTEEIYKACLRYNLVARLAPSWNRVENYFVEEKYFLLKRGPLAAIELRITILGDKLILHACPMRIWLRIISLLDFSLPKSVLEHPVSEKFCLDLSSEPQWVHVLPSFKRGRIVYVSNYIPDSSCFSGYLEMRRHWKNTYGYRLPEEGAAMIYVGINFFGTMSFSYPLPCVRRGLHCNIGDTNMVNRFCQSVQSKVPVICGSVLVLFNPQFLETQIIQSPSVDLKWTEESLGKIDSAMLERWLACGKGNRDSDESQLSLYTESIQPSQPCLSLNTVPAHIQGEDRVNSDEWLLKCSEFIEGLSQIQPRRRRRIRTMRPVFREFLPECSLSEKINLKEIECIDQRNEVETLDESNRENTIIKPLFSKSVRRNYFAQDDYAKTYEDENKSEMEDKLDEITTNKLIPIFCKSLTRVSPPEGILLVNNRKNENNNDLVSYEMDSKFVNDMNRMRYIGEDSIRTTVTSNILTMGAYQPSKDGVDPVKPVFKTSKMPSVATQVKMVSSKTVLKRSATPSVVLSPITLQALRKNKLEHTKKIKPKDINETELLKLRASEQLGKANVPSLIAYLKSKGIHCRSKDKKPDLLKKVQDYMSQNISSKHV